MLENDTVPQPENPVPEMSDPPSEPPEDATPDQTPNHMTIEQWLERLRSSDRAFYNMMAMEVWSIAKSMDTLIPGFWHRFMTNRREAMQKFLAEKRTQVSAPLHEPEAAGQVDPLESAVDEDLDTESVLDTD
ncbi:hypothetical protein [Alkalinema sp. FACHB-956]|uniref:hypothetical protein n=1 Tax=Alkalinema sp. FACHB-956 TaxID=2692768 RepID=UPI00168A32BD|nr:hypothetical protein [Alkalinema sp. FACHB-956]MBD2328943.1 hypothetical protein [Alkalinema sp. FACHB-956]